MPVLATVKFNKIFQDHLTNKSTVRLHHFNKMRKSKKNIVQFLILLILYIILIII